MEEKAQNLEEILQDCLKRIQRGEDTLESALARYPQIAAELQPLLEAALWLQARQAALQPRPGYISASRNRLVEQIQQEQAAPPASSGWERFLQSLSAGFQQRRRAVQFAIALVLVLALVLTAGGVGMARASQDAIPGDRLYGLKRTLEKAELALTPNEAAKAELYIHIARQRLDEIQVLIEKNRTDQIEETVSLFEDHVYHAISILMTSKDQDGPKIQELAQELNFTLLERSSALRSLAASSSPQVNQEVDRLLGVADGIVVLMGDRFPAGGLAPGIASTQITSPVSGTTKASSTSTAANPFPSETFALPSVTPTPPTRPIVVIPSHTPPPARLSASETPTPTVTISRDDGDSERTPTPKHTKKPTKTPKPKKTDKPPKPPRPPKHDNGH